MIPYGRQSMDPSDERAVLEVLQSDWLTTGPAVEQFESDLARTVASEDGAEPHVTAVTSGTAALHVAYAAAGIGPGTEVVTTPLTFVATASTAALLGATIIFADVDPDTGNLDPAAAESATTSRTRAIAAVDFAGVPVPATTFRDLAHRHDAVFVEDAAHAIGSTMGGRPVGLDADLTTFSFFPTKNVTTGEGGAVLTPDPELHRRARAFRNHGLVRDPALQRWPDEGPWHQEVSSFGLNYRLPDILAALGSSQLRRLATFKRRRAEIVAAYDEAFASVDAFTTPHCPEGADPMWHLYPLRVPHERRRRMVEHLRGEGIAVQVNYIPAYWHPVFADLGYRRGQCPQAEAYYRREISLPLFADLTDGDVDRVIETTIRALHA